MEGFPWDRVHAARSYLLALKPWLAPLVNTLTLVPVDRPPVSHSAGWVRAPRSDREGRVYLDRSYCLSEPVHVLAGTLEHEAAKFSRNMFSRLAWVSEDDWADIAVPAMQMEIVDAMERERERYTLMLIEQRVSKSHQFTVYDMERWGITDAPTVVPAGAFRPEALHLPPQRSAETYATLLLRARHLAEFVEDTRDDAGSSSSGAGGDADAGDDDRDAGSSDPDDLQSAPAGGQPGAEAEPGAEADGDGDAVADGSPLAEPTIDEILGEVGAHRVDQARRERLASAEGMSWSQSMPHPADTLAASRPDAREERPPAPSASQMDAALLETSLLTIRCAGFVAGPDDAAVVYAHNNAQSRGQTWEAHLARVVSRCLVSERQRGASDITYAVANPNQPMVGVRLMGLTDYSPSVTIIQDVSGSMVGRLADAMDAMSTLMTRLMTRLQATAEWVTVADGIVDVGRSAVMSEEVRRRWMHSGGGTDLGGVISALMGGEHEVRWKGRRLAVPDLLVVSTDALFTWPSTRPSRAHRLLVVVYSHDHVSHLPEWVNRDTEVVVVET